MRASTLVGALATLACLAPSAWAQSTYVAYGDSITMGTGDTVLGEEGTGGYPARLQTLLGGGNTVINRGQFGGTTVDMLNNFADQVRGNGADVMLLMIGTNDVSKFANNASDAIPFETTVRNIAVLANRASNAGLRTIHATVIPRYPAARADATNIVTDQLNGEVRSLAGVDRSDLVDVNDRFFQEPRWNALYIANRPGDPVGHPSPEGYDQIADAFADVINGVDSARPAPGVLAPLNGERLVDRGRQVRVELWDFGSGIDPASVEVRVNGTLVGSAPVISGARATVTYSPPSPLQGRVDVEVRARDTANPPNELNGTVATFFTRRTNFPTGDVNRDGRVDGRDLQILAAGFGQDPGSFRYDPDADLDGDGDIDGADLAILVDNFGTSI